MGDFDHGVLALCWRLIRFFKMEPTVPNVRFTALPSNTAPRNLFA